MFCNGCGHSYPANPALWSSSSLCLACRFNGEYEQLIIDPDSELKLDAERDLAGDRVGGFEGFLARFATQSHPERERCVWGKERGCVLCDLRDLGGSTRAFESAGLSGIFSVLRRNPTVEAVRAAMDAGARIDATYRVATEPEQTAIDVALRHHASATVLAFLLDHGATVPADAHAKTASPALRATLRQHGVAGSLLELVRSGAAREVESALEAGGDPNEPGVLAAALEADSIAIVESLLKHGADPNAHHSGAPLTVQIVGSGDPAPTALRLVQAFCRAGARFDVVGRDGLDAITHACGWRWLELADAMAPSTPHGSCLAIVCDPRADGVGFEGEDAELAFDDDDFEFPRSSRLEMATWVLRFEPDLETRHEYFLDETPLLLAIRCRDHALVELLLGKGADLDALSFSGETAAKLIRRML